MLQVQHLLDRTPLNVFGVPHMPMVQPNPTSPLSLRSLSGRSYFSFRLSRRFLFRSCGAGATLVAVCLAAGWAIHSSQATEQKPFGSRYALPPGPWGNLTAHPILLATPTGKISTAARQGDGHWYVHAASADEVVAFLRESGLDEDRMRQVAATVRPVSGNSGLFAATPSSALITGLDRTTRSRLYARLSRWPENLAQTQPFHTTEKILEEWLADLPADTAADIENLLWRSGAALLFSDYNTVADSLPSAREKLEVLKAVSRKPSMVLELRIGAQSESHNLARYWGIHGRTEQITPLLESLARSGEADLDVSNLLPAFARERLHRYPDPLRNQDTGPDCHFTSLNFFARGEPDARLHDPRGAEGIFREQYTEARGEPQFGDIVVLTTPEGETVHSAVHIAADIVFTKNGMGLTMPWVFSTLEQMFTYYPGEQRLQVSYYRKRP
jgi:hypothetical protein